MQKCFDIRPVSQGDYYTLKKLWLQCFDDSEKTVENFFKKTASPQNIIATFNGDEAINAMYLLDSTINIEGNNYKAYYIYAVCTDPSYRGMGLMKKAFSYLESIVAQRCIDYVFLVPASESLFSMYEKLGFKLGLTYDEKVIKTQSILLSEKTKIGFNYEKYCKSRQSCSFNVPLITLGERAFNSFYSPVDDSVCCLSTDDGYAVCEQDGDRVIVHELFGDENIFLGDVATQYKSENIILRKPCDKRNNAKPFGMYRSFGNGPEIKDAFFGIPYGV